MIIYLKKKNKEKEKRKKGKKRGKKKGVHLWSKIAINLLNPPPKTHFWILCSCWDKQVGDTDVTGLRASKYVFHFLLKLRYYFLTPISDKTAFLCSSSVNV